MCITSTYSLNGRDKMRASKEIMMASYITIGMQSFIESISRILKSAKI